jgi:hypothetical protein
MGRAKRVGDLKNKKMDNTYIPKEEAVILKEMGFRDTVLVDCDNTEIGFYLIKTRYFDEYPEFRWKITYHQAFRWFREEHGYHAWPTWSLGNTWNYNIQKLNIDGLLSGQLTAVIDKQKTYEEAELAALRELIRIVKEKK